MFTNIKVYDIINCKIKKGGSQTMTKNKRLNPLDKGTPWNTSKCKKYDLKPDVVLNGGVCIDYSKE